MSFAPSGLLPVVNVGAFVDVAAFLKADQRHVYVGRPTPLGNPWRIARKAANAIRHEAQEKYRRWLWEKIKARDKEVMNALLAIPKDAILGCWCQPKPYCHAEIIASCLEWMWDNPDALRAYRTEHRPADPARMDLVPGDGGGRRPRAAARKRTREKK